MNVISIDCHLPNVGAHVFDSYLLHPVMNHLQFIFGNLDMNLFVTWNVSLIQQHLLFTSSRYRCSWTNYPRFRSPTPYIQEVGNSCSSQNFPRYWNSSFIANLHSVMIYTYKNFRKSTGGIKH